MQLTPYYYAAGQPQSIVALYPNPDGVELVISNFEADDVPQTRCLLGPDQFRQMVDEGHRVLDDVASKADRHVE